jgi:hypothetical protein
MPLSCCLLHPVWTEANYYYNSTTFLVAWRCRYVYQKAYVEFFCSPELFKSLEAVVSQQQTITYLAVNSSGEFRSNLEPEAVNAVTWGVFPGKEVVQPTVVDPKSFLVWKVWSLCKISLLTL